MGTQMNLTMMTRIHNLLICVTGSSLVSRECLPCPSHKREGTLSGPQSEGEEKIMQEMGWLGGLWAFLGLKEIMHFLYSFVDPAEWRWGPSWVGDTVSVSQGRSTSAKDQLSYTYIAAHRASVHGPHRATPFWWRGRRCLTYGKVGLWFTCWSISFCKRVLAVITTS